VPSTYYVAWWNLENLFDEENSPLRTEKLQRTIKPGVYIFATALMSVTKGRSDIYYIGKTNNLRVRVGKHLYRVKRSSEPLKYGGWVGPEVAPEQGIARLVEQGRFVELGWVVTSSVDAALQSEASLLRAYEDEHRQLPPNNRIGGASVRRT
jgi:excinuclease UvrABC nuclease subunit